MHSFRRGFGEEYGIELSNSGQVPGIAGTQARSELYCTDFIISEMRKFRREPFGNETSLQYVSSGNCAFQSAQPAAAERQWASEG
jgi:hypothetical protein